MTNHPSPPPDLATRRLPIKRFRGNWYRIHRLKFDPVHFGRPGPADAASRFDAPAGEYGVLYVARDLHGAFVETLGHDTGRRRITEDALTARGAAVLTFTRPLRLVDLRAEGLARLGADAALTCATDSNYALCRAWSKALHEHPKRPDGVVYRARHDPSRFCAALFDRVAPDLRCKRRRGSLGDGSLSTQIEAIMELYHYGLAPPLSP